MNKLDMLYVRACKSRNARTRLKSIVRRFYLVCAISDRVIMSNLARICDEYNLIDLQGFINCMQPSNVWKYKGSDDDDPTIGILISTIELSRIDKFPGYIPHRRFAK